MLSAKLKNVPLPVLVLLGLLGVYSLYTLLSNPLIGFFLKGMAAIAPLFGKILLGLLKYFAALFVIQFILCKTVSESLYRKLAWIGVILLANLLDHLGLFGSFTWNPLKIKSSMEYLMFEMQLLSFYYVIITMLLPKKIWGFLSSVFIALLSVISSGVSIIPVVGSIVGSLISIVVTFAVLTSVVLNLVVMALLRMEKMLVPREKAVQA